MGHETPGAAGRSKTVIAVVATVALTKLRREKRRQSVCMATKLPNPLAIDHLNLWHRVLWLKSSVARRRIDDFCRGRGGSYATRAIDKQAKRIYGKRSEMSVTQTGLFVDN
jgi:hypothetical protein